MKVVVAIDSFKGSLDSVSAGRAAAEGIRRALPDAICTIRPLADGGEGTLDALVSGLGGTTRTVRVTGPLGEPVMARYGLLPDGTAIVEMAAAAGLALVPEARRDPRRTTTRGVGELILDAREHGAKSFVVGIGGSATNDGGAGLLQALGWRFRDASDNELPPGGAALAQLARILPPQSNPLADCSFRVACDVTNPLCGPNGASRIFGPQKGATPAMAHDLDAALAHFAAVAARDPSRVSLHLLPGTGAAGGLGYAFKAFLNAELVPGVELVLQATRLEECLRDADVVVTGEGRIDGQTAMGKAPAGVARLAKRHGKRVIAFCGCVGEGAEAVHAAGIDAYFPVLRTVTTLETALDAHVAARNLSATVEQVFRLLV